MESSVDVSCIVCKCKVVNTLVKCVKCDKIGHPSCVKRRNCILVINKTEMVCCSATNCDNEDTETALSIENNGDDIINSETTSSQPPASAENMLRKEVQLLREVINCKEVLINEMQGKINLLYDHIDLLKSISQTAMGPTSSSQNPKHSTNPLHQNSRVERDAFSTKNESHEPNKLPIDGETKPMKNKNVNDKQTKNVSSSQKISNEVLSKALLEAQTATKLNEIIYATDDSKETSKEWSTAKTRKSHRKTSGIVGKSKQVTEIKTAPRKSFLHISRLSPETTVAQITKVVKQTFPEAVCEQLQSKYPEHYTSFKVTIDLENFEKALNPELWPSGTYVSRFFQKRKRTDKAS